MYLYCNKYWQKFIFTKLFTFEPSHCCQKLSSFQNYRYCSLFQTGARIVALLLLKGGIAALYVELYSNTTEDGDFETKLPILVTFAILFAFTVLLIYGLIMKKKCCLIIYIIWQVCFFLINHHNYYTRYFIKICWLKCVTLFPYFQLLLIVIMVIITFVVITSNDTSRKWNIDNYINWWHIFRHQTSRWIRCSLYHIYCVQHMVHRYSLQMLSFLLWTAWIWNGGRYTRLVLQVLHWRMSMLQDVCGHVRMLLMMMIRHLSTTVYCCCTLLLYVVRQVSNNAIRKMSTKKRKSRYEWWHHYRSGYNDDTVVNEKSH